MTLTPGSHVGPRLRGQVNLAQIRGTKLGKAVSALDTAATTWFLSDSTAGARRRRARPCFADEAEHGSSQPRSGRAGRDHAGCRSWAGPTEDHASPDAFHESAVAPSSRVRSIASRSAWFITQAVSGVSDPISGVESA